MHVHVEQTIMDSNLPVPTVILSIPATPVPPIMKEFAVTNSTVVMQVYSPDWFLPNGLTVAVLVYLVSLSITELATGRIVTPIGADI